MNGDISDYDSSAVTSGLSDSQPQNGPFREDDFDWDRSKDGVWSGGTEPGNEVWTRGGTTPDDPIPGGGSNACMDAAGDPPGSGTWILGSIDGTCQWIDTTDCTM